MVVALDPRLPFAYVLKSDRSLPPDQQTRFQLRPLTYQEDVYLRDQTVVISEDGGGKVMMGSRRNLRLRLGLVGWSNLRDAQGRDVPFATEEQFLAGEKRPVVSTASLERLSRVVREELADAVEEAVAPTAEERGN